MKSISPIIATIFLFIVLVGLSAFAYFYFSGAMSQLFQIATQRTQQTTVSVLQCGRVGGDIVVNPPLGKYRVPITIQENSGNTLTDYQVLIINPYYDERGLVASYHFDEGSGNIAYDRSGNNNHGTLYNGPTWTDGKFGKALRFDGVDDYVITPNLRNFFIDESVTICSWFYYAGDNGVIVDELGQPQISTGWHDSQIEVVSGKVRIRVWNLPYLELGDVLPGWNFVCLRYSKAQLKLDGFLNGVFSNTYISGDRAAPWESGYGLYYAFGVRDSTNLGDGTYFNGIIDEVRIYNRALSDEEIRKLYEAKMKPNYDDVRFTYVYPNGTEVKIPYWIEIDGRIWVKVPYIPANGQVTIYMYYGNPNAVSESNPSDVFIPNQIYAMSGSCTDSTYCAYMDNHNEADYIRINFPPNICTKYVDKIDWKSVCDNSGPACPGGHVREQFYQRFRFLFVAPVPGTWTFSIDSDDGAELVIQYSDAYNNNYDHAFVGHNVIASWYGGHGPSCYVPTSYQGSITLSAGQGIWLEFITEEWGGGEAGRVMVRDLRDNTWKILSASNFNGYIFARKYTYPEPTFTLGQEEALPSMFITLINSGIDLGKIFSIKITYEDGNIASDIIVLNQTLKSGSMASAFLYNLPSGRIRNIKVYSGDVCAGTLVVDKYLSIDIP